MLQNFIDFQTLSNFNNHSMIKTFLEKLLKFQYSFNEHEILFSRFTHQQHRLFTSTFTDLRPIITAELHGKISALRLSRVSLSRHRVARKVCYSGLEQRRHKIERIIGTTAGVVARELGDTVPLLCASCGVIGQANDLAPNYRASLHVLVNLPPSLLSNCADVITRNQLRIYPRGEEEEEGEKEEGNTNLTHLRWMIYSPCQRLLETFWSDNYKYPWSSQNFVER